MSHAVTPEDLVWCDRLVAGVASSCRYPPNISRDDLMQEGRLAMLRAAKRFNPRNAAGASFRTYAYRAIIGAMVEPVRGRRGQDEYAGRLEYWMAAPGRDAEHVQHSRQVRQLVAEAWAYLRPQEQRVLQLRCLDRMTWPEVRREMGLSRPRCSALFRVATVNLRTYLWERGVSLDSMDWPD